MSIPGERVYTVIVPADAPASLRRRVERLVGDLQGSCEAIVIEDRMVGRDDLVAFLRTHQDVSPGSVLNTATRAWNALVGIRPHLAETTQYELVLQCGLCGRLSQHCEHPKRNHVYYEALRVSVSSLQRTLPMIRQSFPRNVGAKTNWLFVEWVTSLSGGGR